MKIYLICSNFCKINNDFQKPYTYGYMHMKKNVEKQYAINMGLPVGVMNRESEDVTTTVYTYVM